MYITQNKFKINQNNKWLDARGRRKDNSNKSVYFDLSERDRETWWASDAREIKEKKKKKERDV